MGTATTNYGFNKPTIGADEDNWGDDYGGGDDPLVDPSPGLNGNWEKVDQLLNQLQMQVTQLQADLTKREIQVGQLYISTTDVDPATSLGYGTWAAWGEGRALVGVGDNGGGNARATEEEFGSDETTLTEPQLPAHLHGNGTLSTGSAGSHTHSSNRALFVTGGGSIIVASNPGGLHNTLTASSVLNASPNHTHPINGSTANTGGNQGHSNDQASKAAYIWKRIT